MIARTLTLTPGTRLGVFEVTALLGEGGMGQVYRATDTTLGRQVAIKVLPESFASDPQRVARLEREAKTLASLNHPHIAAIYGFEKSTGLHALVMELVEGEDLSRRIARGAIPLDEALPIARQIAEALEAAHEQGIVHRDLKPANIKVRADGMVKVLDFGLAKAMDPVAASSAAAMDTPTITSPAMTMRGMILGTAAYMSPEQAKGKPVDRRTDVWAFGAVLYETLTGHRAFKGEDTTDTIAAVVSKEPDWTALPANTPAVIRKLLRRCLEKDRKRRLDSAADARLEIEDALTSPSAESTLAPLAPPVRARLPWAVAGISVTALTAMVLAWSPWRPLSVPPETRTEVNALATSDPTHFALSPDGRQIVFAVPTEGGSQLWVRSLASTTAQPVVGTEGVTGVPFWSPDSRSVGFFAANALKRLDLGGGAPQTLAQVAGGGRGGTWSPDGVIVFSQGPGTSLTRVSAVGGAAIEVTALGPHDTSHRWPHFLPDGRRFLFYAQGSTDTSGIFLGTLDGGAPTRLTTATTAGVYLAEGAGTVGARREGGWLLWVRAGTLLAQRLDLAEAALTGEPVILADGVAANDNNRSAVSVAATGLVAYRMVPVNRRQLTWFDRSGSARGTIGGPDTADLRTPRVSPDGRRVVVSRRVQGNTDLWLLDGSRASRFTFDAATDQVPAWSPDGTRIVFRSSRTGLGDLYLKLTSGASAEERLVASSQPMEPTGWSRDGRLLLYLYFDKETTADLWVAAMLDEGKPAAFLKTPFIERGGVFSPDGRWVAYQSNESGRQEVYVRPFVPPGTGATPGTAVGQWQVSTSGGIAPMWRPDGKGLYYLNPAGAMMAAPIKVTRNTPELGAPVVLFPTRIVGGGTEAGHTRQYDVAPDGRFLINTVLDEASAPITLLMNWSPEAKR